MPIAAAEPRSAVTLRGQLDLSFSVNDRGVAHYSTLTERLRLELHIAADGSIRLEVRGQGENKGAFLTPRGPSAPTRNGFTVNDTWTGQALHTGAHTKLHVARENKNLPPDSREQDFECVQWKSRLINDPTEKLVELMSCTPITRWKGLPWNDPLPSYLRVPLVFAVHGGVLVSVLGDQEHASVGAPHAPRP